MRFRLRTLLILLAIGPPLLAGLWWAWKEGGGIVVLLCLLWLWAIVLLIVQELGPLIRRLLKG